MKQTTAVEWLVEKITNRQNGVFDGLPYLSVHEIYNQAKEMEKQQILETWHNGYENQSPMIDEDNCGEQYYNQTFKK